MFQAVPHKEIAAVPQAQAVLALAQAVLPQVAQAQAVLALAPVLPQAVQVQVAQAQTAPAALQCQPLHLSQLLLHLLQN